MNESVKPPTGSPPGRKPGQPAQSLIRGRDREFLPAALEILETPAAPLPLVLLLTICAFVAAALIWAFVGRLDIYAVAAGKVEINGRSKVIQPLDAGKIAEIGVENGSRVKAGDFLIGLDPTELAADEKGYSDGLLALTAETIRRQTAIDGARAFLKNEREANAASASPQPTGKDADTGTEAAKTVLYAAQSFSPEAEVDWTSAPQRVPAQIRLREEAVLRADFGQLSDTLQNIGKQMAQKDATRQRLTMSLDFQTVLIKTLTDRVGVREAAIKLDVGTRINLFDAQEALQKSQSALASDQGQLIETRAALDELKSQRLKALSQFIADNESKLADAARKADDTAQQLNKARAKLGRTSIKSPIDGTVQQLAVTTIGQVVTTGQQLMLVTPGNGPLQIEALVSNLDIGFVRLGQEAVIKVDAFPFTRYGTLKARIVRIATDAMDEQDAKRGQANAIATANGNGLSPSGSNGQPQSFVFLVTLALEEASIKVDSVMLPIIPGMTVVAEIKTDSRRVIDYLFSPIAKVTSEAMTER